MTEKENNKPALGSQSYGVGGHGVAEPKGSDRGDVFLDEVFDNRQPDRETFEDDVVSDEQPIPRWIKSDYILHVDEIDEIKKLLDKILQIEIRTNKSFRVPCERFSRSFEERRPDDKIIDLVVAFESLFTDENTSRTNVMGELVGVGCSMLIGNSTKHRQEIKRFLIKAFTIRNKIIHSSEVKIPIKVNNKEFELLDFSSQLREYLRVSIKKLI